MQGELNVAGHFKSMTPEDCQRKLIRYLRDTSRHLPVSTLLPPKRIPLHERVMLFISSCLLTVHGQVALGIKEVHDNPVKFLFEIHPSPLWPNDRCYIREASSTLFSVTFVINSNWKFAKILSRAMDGTSGRHLACENHANGMRTA